MVHQTATQRGMKRQLGKQAHPWIHDGEPERRQPGHQHHGAVVSRQARGTFHVPQLVEGDVAAHVVVSVALQAQQGCIGDEVVGIPAQATLLITASEVFLQVCLRASATRNCWAPVQTNISTRQTWRCHEGALESSGSVQGQRYVRKCSGGTYQE